MSRTFSIIVAADSKLGIGKNNDLPWRLPKEMAHFTRTTSTTLQDGKKNAVIMGRRTWDSIPRKFRPLSNRLNVVLSRSQAEAPAEGVLLCRSLMEALEKLAAPPYDSDIERVFVIGGGSVYKEAVGLPACQRLYLTRLDKEFDCDAFFPEVDEVVFRLSSDPQVDSSVQTEKGISYQIFVYDRKDV